jgi:hypothetical protein
VGKVLQEEVVTISTGVYIYLKNISSAYSVGRFLFISQYSWLTLKRILKRNSARNATNG